MLKEGLQNTAAIVFSSPPEGFCLFLGWEYFLVEKKTWDHSLCH